MQSVLAISLKKVIGSILPLEGNAATFAFSLTEATTFAHLACRRRAEVWVKKKGKKDAVKAAGATTTYHRISSKHLMISYTEQ